MSPLSKVNQDELDLLAKSEPKFEIFVENNDANGMAGKYKGKKRLMDEEPKKSKKSKKNPKIDLEFQEPESSNDGIESLSKEEIAAREIKELEAQNKQILESLLKSQKQTPSKQTQKAIQLQLKINDCVFDVLHKTHQSLNSINILPCEVKATSSIIKKSQLCLHYLYFLNGKFSQEPEEARILPGNLDVLWSEINELNGKIFAPALKVADKAFRNSNNCDQKLKSKQLKAINQSISCQIENFMRNPAKLIQRTQLNRRKLTLLGKEIIPIEDANIFDDSDWFSALLSERNNAKSDNHPESIASRVEALKKSKIRKEIDTKASKGRKIKYVVFDKLTNFMAPADRTTSTWNDEKADEFYNSLFGAIPKTLDE